MAKKTVRAVLWLAALTAILWLGRLALTLWIDGPEVRPASEPWPPVPTDSPTPAPSSTSGSTWVPATDDGNAPPSHPVKVKLSSRLYHLPGMAAYGRTRPDRCYQTAEAAEADGFSRAKR